jgi:hypothetical protein
MDQILIYRSLIFALIEYGLFIVVLLRGKNFKYPIAAILFLLASYQLGEFLFLYYDLDFGVRFAIASTTLLPPLGIYLMEKKQNRFWIYYISQVISISFAIFFLFNTTLFTNVTKQFCLLKFSNETANSGFVLFWGILYVLGLSIAMGLAVNNYLKERNVDKKNFYKWTIIAYSSFFPLSLVLTVVFNLNLDSLASIMCALAIFAAFIMTWQSANKDLKIS